MSKALISSTAGLGTRAKGITLILAQILPVMAIVSLFPAIPKLFAEFGDRPGAGFLIPAIVTIPSLVCAIFAPIAGIISDRFGRRKSFIMGLAVYVLAGIAPLFLDSLEAILASRAILGIAEAFAITISSALIGDYFEDDRHRWTSWVGVATSVAGTALIVTGGVLADVSWRGPFAVYLAALPALFMAILVIDEPRKTPRPEGSAVALLGFPWRAAFVIAPVTLITSVLYYVEPLNIARVLDMRGAGSSTQIGIIQAATSIAYIGGAFLYRRLHELAVGRLLAIAGVFIAIGQVIIGRGVDWQTVAFGATIQQIGGGMIIPVLLAWGQSMLPLEQRGRGMGIWATAFFAGTFVCSPLVSLVTSATGGLLPAMQVMGVITLLFALAAPFIVPAPGRKSTQALKA
ncbi:MFS transporter [Sphingorhabdus sp.]|uniref:MFS transporter n=1 Tax=Sphingorhabdus sp. TaxID=1902408 RepID=UPI00391BCCF0